MSMPSPNTGIQTSYSYDMVVAFAGQLADLNDNESRSGNLEGAINIPFGIGLKKGAADDGYIVPTLIGDICVGISVHTHAIDTIGLSGLSPTTAGIQPGEVFTVLRRGYIWVKVEEAVNRGDPVYMRYAAGAGGTILGSFRKSADTATASLVKGAQYMSTALAAGYAVLFFDAGVANN
jgi:hypothetical protein